MSHQSTLPKTRLTKFPYRLSATSISMEPTISSSRFIYIVLLSTTGSGAPHGMHGLRLGIGDIIPVGGMCVTAGLGIATGTTAMRSIIAIMVAPSVQDVVFAMVMPTCSVPFLAGIMQRRIPIARSPAAMPEQPTHVKSAQPIRCPLAVRRPLPTAVWLRHV